MFLKLRYTLFLLLNSSGFLQAQIQLSGTVKGSEGEPVISASVYFMETLNGTTTDFEGFFTLESRSTDEKTLIFSVIGYESDTLNISNLDKTSSLSVILRPATYELEGVEIVADKVIERTTVSSIAFNNAALKTNHGLTEDPLRTIAALPGIATAGDLFSPSQIYVRGGAPDENLFLMDNNKIYFPYYFGGQKSIFNTDVTESVELLTGGFSAAYGNHLSSVLNIQTRDGDFENLHGNFLFGFYNAGGMLEGPIKKDKASFLVALRRTYLDLFLDETAEFPVTSLGDITYKFTFKVNENNKISLSGLSSDESMNFVSPNPEPGLPNKLITGAVNHFQSLQWKSSFGLKFYNKLSIVNSKNNNRSDVGRNLSLNINAHQSGLRDDLTIFLSNKHKLKTGVEWQFGNYNFQGNLPINPLETDPNDPTIETEFRDVSRSGEIIRGGYFMYDGNPINKLGINLGLRADNNPNGQYIDISPRASLNYQLTQKSTIRFSTGVYNQFPDALPNVVLQSNRAIHYITGFEYHPNDKIYGWIEAYYKDYKNLVHLNPDLTFSNNGYGAARGVEIFLRKTKGPLRGWVSYALSKSERLPALSDQLMVFDFDQRHIFNLVGEYHFNSKYPFVPSLIQTNFRYADGVPYTPVIGALQVDGNWQRVYGEILTARNPDYLNVNFRIEWSFGPPEKDLRFISFFEVWNLTNNKNVLGRVYQYGDEFENNISEQEYYTSPFLPGGGFRVEF